MFILSLKHFSDSYGECVKWISKLLSQLLSISSTALTSVMPIFLLPDIWHPASYAGWQQPWGGLSVELNRLKCVLPLIQQECDWREQAGYKWLITDCTSGHSFTLYLKRITHLTFLSLRTLSFVVYRELILIVITWYSLHNKLGLSLHF